MEAMAGAEALPMAPPPSTAKRIELDEAASPTTGRRFTRA
jgi:hypothetical protein